VWVLPAINCCDAALWAHSKTQMIEMIPISSNALKSLVLALGILFGLDEYFVFTNFPPFFVLSLSLSLKFILFPRISIPIQQVFAESLNGDCGVRGPHI